MDVLVVEDDHAGRHLLGMILETRDHSVRAFSGGVDALVAARESTPGLLIVDLLLGGDYSGLDLVAAFRADPTLRAVPILVLTGVTAPSDLRRARDIGASACLPKPVDVRHLLRVVDSLTVGQP